MHLCPRRCADHPAEEVAGAVDEPDRDQPVIEADLDGVAGAEGLDAARIVAYVPDQRLDSEVAAECSPAPPANLPSRGLAGKHPLGARAHVRYRQIEASLFVQMPHRHYRGCIDLAREQSPDLAATMSDADVWALTKARQG